MRHPALAIIAAAALALASCGGDDEDSAAPAGPDPATLAPPDAPLYIEATLRPEGEQKDAAESALSKLLATDDPGGFLGGVLQDGLDEAGSDLLFDTDVEPWLGDSAGVFFRSFGEDADGAVMVATTDPAATQEAIDKDAKSDDAAERAASYRGFDYTVDDQGDAVAIVGDFLVSGTDRSVKEVIDTSEGESLADSTEFADSREGATEDRLAFGYVDVRDLLDALRASGEIAGADLDAAGLGEVPDEPATFTLSATPDTLALESISVGDAESAEQSPLFDVLPEDAWLAFAAPESGAGYEALAGGLSASADGQALTDALGFDLLGALADWGGDIAGYARGTSIFGLGGALVVETRDEEASADTLERLAGALGEGDDVAVEPIDGGFGLTPAGIPLQIQFVQRDGRVVIGLGEDSVNALDSGGGLAGSEAFSGAAAALGDDFAPAAFLDFGTLFDLVESIPDATTDPQYQEAQPYLENLDYLVLGQRADGDGEDAEVSSRLVLGLTGE
jgi:hypothetical protein